MKLRKKVITLSLAVMAALSASISITSNAATSNHGDTYDTVIMYPQNERFQYPLKWRKKLNTSYVYLKISNLSGYTKGNDGLWRQRTVSVSCQGASSDSGLTISNWSKLEYTGNLKWNVNVFNSNRNNRWYTLGNGQYLLWNLIYENGNYAKPARLFFEATDNNDYKFNVAWSPDSIGSYTIV